MILECDAQNGYFVKSTFPYHIYYEEYENILCLIRNELKLYDMNLAYCKKIVDFLTNEFEKKGI